MRARIYQPARNAMQSGRAGSRHWVLEFEPSLRQDTDPLMGWIGQGDTGRQVRLRFETKEDAVAFADRERLDVQIIDPHHRRIRPKSYAANFAHNRVE